MGERKRDTLLSGVLALVLTEIEQTGNPIAQARVTIEDHKIVSVRGTKWFHPMRAPFGGCGSGQPEQEGTAPWAPNSLSNWKDCAR
jgi:hypothetical protein